MSDFSDKLASLVNRERMAAQGDNDRIAEMIDRQIHCLAFTVALSFPPSKRAEVLEGVTQAIYEEAAEAEGFLLALNLSGRQAES